MLDFNNMKDVKSMKPDEVDLMYSPSRWSKLFTGSPEAVVKHHVKVVSEASEKTKACVPNECGVSYGPSEKQRLDIFGGDALPDDAPILVHIHGGYWQALGREISSYVVRPLFNQGIRVIVVGYDLTPTVTVAEIVEQIKRAATYAMNLATKLGSRSVSFSGHSCGGHLVMALMNSEWLTNLKEAERKLIKSLLLISGVFDLTPLVQTHVNDALRLTMEEAVSVSPMFYAGKEYTPVKVLAIIGEFDTPQYKIQTWDYAKKLQSVNDQVEVICVPGVDHFELAEQLTDDDYVLTKKMVEYIKN